MQLDELLIEFGKKMSGQVIRNQKVEYAELLMDNFTEEKDIVRYLLMVVFEDAVRPYNEDINEYLERMTNESPCHAFAVTLDRGQLERWLTMQEQPEWILEDEIDLRVIGDEE